MDNLELTRAFYSKLKDHLDRVHSHLRRPLTLAEKILYAHLYDFNDLRSYVRGGEYALFRPDRVAMQDATAQMALLQFMNAGRQEAAVPTSVHCNHLIEADKGAKNDLARARKTNGEVYDFLRSAAGFYGIDFWPPGSGIIHQVVLENYAFPGGMMVGTDSHTPNAGGLGMVAIGVGGADAVDVMTGMPWELKMPRIIGVRLTGKLSGWATPKDVILKLAGILTVKGATNAIIEYFGDGAATLTATGKATICNMGAEVGATTSLFPYDEQMHTYLSATGREPVAVMAGEVAGCLRADDEVYHDPASYYDRVVEINLDELQPYLNGPFTPDAATVLPGMREKAEKEKYPLQVEVGLVGSCTNSSYEDLTACASVLRQALDKGLDIQAELVINPGSEKVFRTAERDGLISLFEEAGAVIMANACGPCIGQWKRDGASEQQKNTIVTSFNRNFAKRADGNPNTYAFVASPPVVMALAIAGDLRFDPQRDTLLNRQGKEVMLDPPVAQQLPASGFAGSAGCILPATGEGEVILPAVSDRLQRLEPFDPWDGKEMRNLPLLIKVSGKCTTDHISMAGPWLRYRGHLEHISDNLLMGATNSFTGEVNRVFNPVTGQCDAVSAGAKSLKKEGLSSVIVAGENYGEGSSRGHAAMEPRFLGVRVVLAKSFARIHETNLKKQGLLAITFTDPADFDRIGEHDRFCIEGLSSFTPGIPLTVTLIHPDGSTEAFKVNHTYNENQMGWFKAGSALNFNAKINNHGQGKN